MTTPTPPFVTAANLESLWRPLSGAEKEYAEILIAAASAWIRDRRPDIDSDDPAARLVVIEVVKAVLLPGQWQGYASWSKTVGERVEAATLANPTAALAFTDWHYELLGISRSARPVGHFPRNDY